MFSVPPLTGVPPPLRAWRPLLSSLEPVPVVPDDPGLLVPPQAAAVIASTARPATTRAPRVREFIVVLSSFEGVSDFPTDLAALVCRGHGQRGHSQDGVSVKHALQYVGGLVTL